MRSTSSVISDIDNNRTFHRRQYQYDSNNKLNRWKFPGFVVDAVSSLLQNAASAVALLILWGISKVVNIFGKLMLRRDDCGDSDCTVEWTKKINSMRAIAEEDSKGSVTKRRNNLKQLSSRITEELDDKMIVLTVNNGPLKGEKLAQAKSIAQQKLQEIAKLEADQKHRLALKQEKKVVQKDDIITEGPAKNSVAPQVSPSQQIAVPTVSIIDECQVDTQDNEATIIANKNTEHKEELASHQSSLKDVMTHAATIGSSVESSADGYSKIFYDDATDDVLDVDLFEVARAAQEKVSDLIGAVFDTVDEAQASAATAINEASALLSNCPEVSTVPLQLVLASKTDNSSKNFLSINEDNHQSSSGITNTNCDKEEGSSKLAPTDDSNNTGTWEKIKSKGVSGVISYVLTELGFWILFPVLIYFYEVLVVHDVPNLADPDDRATIIGMTVGFLTLARVAVPARFALALSLIPFVEDNITKPFLADQSTKEEE